MARPGQNENTVHVHIFFINPFHVYLSINVNIYTFKPKNSEE